jgi:type IV secretory pathway TrbL component
MEYTKALKALLTSSSVLVLVVVALIIVSVTMRGKPHYKKSVAALTGATILLTFTTGLATQLVRAAKAHKTLTTF